MFRFRGGGKMKNTQGAISYVKANKVYVGKPQSVKQSVNIFLTSEEAKSLNQIISAIVKRNEGLRLIVFPKEKTVQVYATDHC